MITPENSTRPSAAFTSCSCSSSARLRVGGALQPAQLHSSSNLHSDTSFSLHSLQTTQSTFCTQQVIKNNWEQHSGCPMFMGPHTASEWAWKVLKFHCRYPWLRDESIPQGFNWQHRLLPTPIGFWWEIRRASGSLWVTHVRPINIICRYTQLYSPTHILSPFKIKIHSPVHSGKSLFQNYLCEFWKKIVKKQTNK